MGLTSIKQAFKIPNGVVIISDAAFRTGISQTNPTKQANPTFTIDQTDNRDPALNYQSTLNTPVYTNIEFLPGTYETNTKGVFKSFGSDTDGPDRLRYETVLVTVSQSKKIIKTEIQGRDGTIKEYIGLDDYQVSVRGIITGKNGQRPVDQISALKKMLDAPIAVEVASTYLQMLGIHFMVLESYELGETEGGYSYQTFSMNFLSDVQQELTFTNQ